MKNLNPMTFAIGALLPLVGCSTPANKIQPNVIIFFVDDMGYGDTAPFGSQKNLTPNLQRMVDEGVMHTQFYLSSTNSTPSRSALLTGCYANTVGMEGKVNFPGDKRGLDPDEMILPEIFKSKGYVTACFGKWHLGDQREFLPLQQGFDYFEGLPYSSDMWILYPRKEAGFPPLPYMKGNDVVAHVGTEACQTLLTQTITDATVDFIREQGESPFFVYVPYSAPHVPRYAREEIVKECGGDVLSAQICEIDRGVGAVLDLLREKGLDKNTLVLFTSDNGGSRGTSMGNLRGSKYTTVYEGHSRASTIVWGSGVEKAGVKSSEIIASKDILPSLASLIGFDMATMPRPIAGEDNLGALLGREGARSTNDTLYYQLNGIRVGDMKLIKVKDGYELYDLGVDEGETDNIIEKHKERAEQLKSALAKFTAEITENARGAAFVENPVVILPDAEGVPMLCDYLGYEGIVAISED